MFNHLVTYDIIKSIFLIRHILHIYFGIVLLYQLNMFPINKRVEVFDSANT
jgi:hypothetical protein